MDMRYDLIFDGDVRGRFIGEAVQQYAYELGWTETCEDADAELYWEAVDEAVEFLNKNVAEGYYYDFEDGSFFLMKIGEENDDELL